MKSMYVIVLISLLASSCISSDPQAIEYGRDQCAYCMMSISDPKFGAELVTDKGRVLKYDAAECMAGHLSEGATPHQSLLAVPYDFPGTLVSVAELHFLISPDYISPMGANLTAFADVSNLPEQYHAQVIDWAQVCERLAD